MATIALNSPTVYLFPVIWFVAYKLINNFWLWLLFVPISLVIVRTIRSWYFKEDVFDHPFELYESGIQSNLNQDEDMEYMCSPIWESTSTRASYFPSLATWRPHSCQPEVHFSENGKWKTTITHNKWRFIPGLKVENEFTVRCERVFTIKFEHTMNNVVGKWENTDEFLKKNIKILPNNHLHENDRHKVLYVFQAGLSLAEERARAIEEIVKEQWHNTNAKTEWLQLNQRTLELGLNVAKSAVNFLKTTADIDLLNTMQNQYDAAIQKINPKGIVP